VTIEMELDASKTFKSDNIFHTIDYFTVCQHLQLFGDGQSWRLIEALATDIADMVLFEFKPEVVTVEVKKFIIPQARYVSFSLTKKWS
jgi:FolB domain-containing protein